MMKRIFCLLALAAGFGGTPLLAQDDQQPLRIWTVEGEDDGGFQFLMALAEDFGKAKGIRVEVENRDVETMREDFSYASMAGAPPDVVWTVSDHVAPFNKQGFVLPLEGMFDFSIFTPLVLEPGKAGAQVALPVSFGNHLMLYYHKSMVPSPPLNTGELVQLGAKLTQGNTYGLVFNQGEPFWLVPWLHGFAGAFLDSQGNPTLNTPSMELALQFLSDLKNKHRIVPPESDYGFSDSLFKKKDSKTRKYLAAMIINGDWALGMYSATIPDLGVAPLPTVSGTGLPAKPYVAGKYCMLPVTLKENKARLDLVVEFLKFVTSKESQLKMTQTLTRLPVRKDLLNGTPLGSNPRENGFLQTFLAQALKGVAMPSVPQMRYVWDNTRIYLQKVLSGQETPESAAEKMQAETLQAMEREKNP